MKLILPSVELSVQQVIQQLICLLKTDDPNKDKINIQLISNSQLNCY